LSNCKKTLKGLGDFKREGPVIGIVKYAESLCYRLRREGRYSTW